MAVAQPRPQSPAAIRKDAALRNAAPAPEAGKGRAHAGCSHAATKSARAACRREAAKIDREGAKPAEHECTTKCSFPGPNCTALPKAIIERVATREQELDDAFEDEADDVLKDLDGDAYADAVIASLGSQQ